MPLILPSSDFADLATIAAQARDLAAALRRLADNGGRPSAADLAGAPVIDYWLPTTRLAPALIGLVSGHPRVGSGSTRATITSELFAVDTTVGWARTWSRFYRLGDAAPTNGRELQ